MYSLALLGLFAFFSTSLRAQDKGSITRRFALVCAAEEGGLGLQALHFAISDAQKMAQALTELGGVDAADLILDTQLRSASFARRLQNLKQDMRAAKRRGQRVEFIFYYSGHADEEGLRLGDDKLRFRDLRQAIETCPADLRIIVVDACAAGELTRKKGGRARAAFLLDSSNEVSGLAIMTSSSAEEASQESDRLGGSFFTHYLINALRSAAAAIYFDTDLHGQLYVLDAEGQVQAQIDKKLGRPVRLGLEPGDYSVSLQLDKKMWISNFALRRHDTKSLAMSNFALSELEPTRSRGVGQSLSGLRYQDRFLELALWPGASSDAALGMYRVNHLSLTLLGGDGARLDGFALSLLRNRCRLNLRGMQLSLLGLNQVGQQGIGFQFALLANSVGADFYGLQLALVNVVTGRMTGLQISPALGLAINSAYGLQLAGLSNLNFTELRGAQIAGGFNGARRLRGLQIGLVNMVDKMDGLQIGVVNLAHRVRGAQVGLVNLADEIKGAPLGLLSLSRNGLWHGELWIDDMHMTNLGFQLGNDLAYTLFSASFNPEVQALQSSRHWALSLGLGLRLAIDERWAFDTDIRALQLWQNDWSVRSLELANSLRLALRYQIFSRFALKAGLDLNLAIDNKLDQARLTPLPRWQINPSAPQLSLWPGLFVGMFF